jgi:single-strand DNA-binding protein
MNDAQVTLTGYVATDPAYRTNRDGVSILSMRMGWTPRRRDRSTGAWVDGHTSFLSVTCWRKLADNASHCLRKGDPVVVSGRLSVRPYDDKQGVRRTAVDVDAITVGHDLNRGVSKFTRTFPSVGKTADEQAADLAAGGSDADLAETDPEEAAALAALARAAAPGSGAGDDDEMFDDSGIEGLAKRADEAGVPF